jgi:antitoxin (DNA-binding transcriptional repressor) of toxin-antitoxin stability system
MKHPVELSELRSCLDEVVHAVKQGLTITVAEGGVPVADLAPRAPGGDGLVVYPPTSGIHGFAGITLPAPLENWEEIKAILDEERRLER